MYDIPFLGELLVEFSFKNVFLNGYDGEELQNQIIKNIEYAQYLNIQKNMVQQWKDSCHCNIQLYRINGFLGKYT